MTQEEIIELAKQAGFERLGHDDYDYVCYPDDIESFAKLVAKRTWVGLTDEEIEECLKGLPTQTIDIYARRIEAKLKEKNNG